MLLLNHYTGTRLWVANGHKLQRKLVKVSGRFVQLRDW